MKSWTTAPLSKVLKPVARAVEPTAGTSYRQIGVRLWGEGAYERESIDGLATKYAHLFQAQEGDVIVNKIWARNGSVAVVQPNLDGTHGSSEFPMFEPDRSQVDPRWIHWLTKTRNFWFACDEKSRGSSGKNRIKPERFLEIEIPLPPLPEQRRVVARIEEVAGLASDVNSLHEEVAACDTALEVSLAHRRDLIDEQKLGRGWEFVALAEVIEQVEDRVAVRADGEYPNFGILSFGRGLFQKPAILGLESSAKFLNRVHAGQFIYSRLFAFEGAYGQVTSEYDGGFVSNEYPTFRCDPERVLASFLVAYFKPKEIWRSVAEGSKGLGDRRQRVQPLQILKHTLWLPPLEVQLQAEQIGTERSAAGKLRRESSAALDALLPAVLDRAFRGEL